MNELTLPDLLRTLNAKGRHPKWRSKCPAHKSRGLTLAIYADKGGEIGVHCHAGCTKDDVLAGLGLSWKDLKPEREKVSPQAFREMQRNREAEEARATETRIGEWCIRFIREGYTLEDRQSDVEVVAACSIVLSNKATQHWEGILRTHMERIAAADYCMTQRMLPPNAKAKWVL